MIIAAWWLRTSNKFMWKESKRQPKGLENGQLLSGGKLQILPKDSALGGLGAEPRPPEVRGCGGGAPSARKFCIFLQK